MPIADSPAAIHQRAVALFAAGQQREGLLLLFETLGHAQPAERASVAMAPLRRLVASRLHTIAISVANDTVLAVLASVASDPDVDPQSLAPTLMALLTGSDAARALRAPAASVVTDGARDLVTHPLVSLLLPRIAVDTASGAALCASWRQALLQRAIDPAFSAQQWLWNGIAWLGAAAGNSGYAWAETPEETTLVEAMSEALTTALASGASTEPLAPVFLTYAMYRPRSTLSERATSSRAPTPR